MLISYWFDECYSDIEHDVINKRDVIDWQVKVILQLLVKCDVANNLIQSC